jgi:WD40 repeat protein
VNDAIFSENGRWVITISDDDTARVWEVATGKALAELKGHTGDVLALDLNTDKFFATASVDKTARVWNIAELSTIEVAKPRLTAEPSNYSGKCPVTIKFTGTIEVVGSGGTVKYRFIRNNGEKREEHELTFDSPGSKEVNDTWRRSGPGWELLEITSPQLQESEKAVFKIACPQPSPSPSPEESITTVEPDLGSVPGTVLSPEKAGVQGADVTLVDGDKEAVFWTKTDLSGRFRLHLPNPGSKYQVMVSSEGYITALKDLAVPLTVTLYKKHPPN